MAARFRVRLVRLEQRGDQQVQRYRTEVLAHAKRLDFGNAQQRREDLEKLVRLLGRCRDRLA